MRGATAAWLGDPVLLKAKERLHARLLELELPTRDSVRPGVDLGYRWDGGGGEYVTIHATPFASWFEKRELKAILKWLDRTGALRKANPESTSGVGGYDWAVSWPRWAKGGKKVRLIIFRLPNKGAAGGCSNSPAHLTSHDPRNRPLATSNRVCNLKCKFSRSSRE